MNRKRILHIAVIFAVSVTACAVALPFAVTPLINTEPVKARLTRIVQSKTGIGVRFSQLAFIFAPLPGIAITDIHARTEQGCQVTIHKALVELDPARLLKFKAAVRRITLQSPGLIRHKAAVGGHKIPVPMDIAALVQKGFDGLLALAPPDTNHLDIIVTNARSDYFTTMDCRIGVTRRTRAVNLRTKISGLLLDTRSIPELDAAMKGRITRIEVPGLELDLSHDKNTMLAGTVKMASFQAHIKASQNRCIEAEDLNFHLTLAKDRLNAHLAPFKLIYPKGRIGINTSLFFGKQTSHIEFTGEQIDISQARELCLPLLKELETSRRLFHILRAGTAQHIVVGFKGNDLYHLFDTKNLFIKGHADFARVKIPGVPIIADNVSGRAEMKDKVLSIYPKAGYVEKTMITGGNLDIDLGHCHAVPFSGKFPLKLALPELPAALIAMLPGTVLAREMSKISGLTGRADAILELNRTPESQGLDVKVAAENIRANGNYRRLPLPIHITGGSFMMDNHKISLKNITGGVGNSRISHLNAGIDTRGPVPMNIKSMAANIILDQAVPLADLFPEAREKLGLVKKFSGIMDMENLKIKGPMFSPDQWQIHMAGQVNQGAVIFSDNTRGISGLSCEFTVAPSTIKLSELGCTIKDVTWLQKSIPPEYAQSIVLPLALTRGLFLKQAGACLLQGQLCTISGETVAFTVDGPAMDKMTPSQIRIADGKQTHAEVAFYKKPDMPRLHFSGKLNKTTLENMLYPDSYLYRKLQEVTGENALTVSTDNTGNITITADRLNLDPLLAVQKTPARDFPPRPLVKQKQLFLNINTLGYKNRIYQGVQARVAINRTTTDIDIAHADLCGLNLSGRITIYHAGGSPKVSTRFSFNTDQAKEVALSIGCLTGSQSIIKGRYTLEGALSGTAPTLTQVTSRQNGHLSFRAQSGRIFKATLLSRLLSVLNILGETDLQQQGFGFKSFTANADIKKGVVHIKKAFIDADNMAIIAQGWANPQNDTLDITFLVAPFKAIDTIIKQIPVVNTILNGRLVSFPARAYGKISNPTVVPLHPSAVGKGLLNLLANLAKTPARLIEEVKENEK